VNEKESEMNSSRFSKMLQGSRWVLASALLFISLLAPVASRADRPGPFGLGIVLGDPTGVSANYELSA